jgi:hypothetical protein
MMQLTGGKETVTFTGDIYQYTQVNFTLAFWVKMTSGDDILTVKNGAANVVRFTKSAGQIVCLFNGDAVTVHSFTPSAGYDHIVFISRSGGYEMYINGVAVKSVVTGTEVSVAVSSLVLGSASALTDMLIADIRYHHDVRWTAGQILNAYSRGYGSYCEDLPVRGFVSSGASVAEYSDGEALAVTVLHTKAALAAAAFPFGESTPQYYSLVQMVNILAASSAMQTLFTMTQAQLYDALYIARYRDDDGITYPYGLVYMTNPASAGVEDGLWVHRGALEIVIEKDYGSSSLDEAGSYEDFTTAVEEVINDIKASRMLIRSINIAMGPGKAPDTESLPDVFGVRLAVEWGME